MNNPIEYARLAAQPGTMQRNTLLTALSRYGIRQIEKLHNPTSGRDDGVMPTRTCVVVCRSSSPDMSCVVKFYEDSEAGKQKLNRHGMLLIGLHAIVPVPLVISAENDPHVFGLPALVTTFIGDSADRAILALSPANRHQLTEDFAKATDKISRINPSDVGLPPVLPCELEGAVKRIFNEDSQWYMEQAELPDCPAPSLASRGAKALAEVEVNIKETCLAHLDLTAYNITVQNRKFSGIIDWDHASISCREEELGKAILGLLVTFPIPHRERFEMVDVFINHNTNQTGSAPLAFALDAALDWLIGGKNAPCEDLQWAVTAILNRMETTR